MLKPWIPSKFQNLPTRMKILEWKGEGLEEEAIDEPDAKSAGNQGDEDEIVCVHIGHPLQSKGAVTLTFSSCCSCFMNMIMLSV